MLDIINAFDVLVLVSFIAGLLNIVMILDIARRCDGQGVLEVAVFGVLGLLVSGIAVHDAFILLCYHFLPINYCPAVSGKILAANQFIFLILAAHSFITKQVYKAESEVSQCS